MASLPMLRGNTALRCVCVCVCVCECVLLCMWFICHILLSLPSLSPSLSPSPPSPSLSQLHLGTYPPEETMSKEDDFFATSMAEKPFEGQLFLRTFSPFPMFPSLEHIILSVTHFLICNIIYSFYTWVYTLCNKMPHCLIGAISPKVD